MDPDVAIPAGGKGISLGNDGRSMPPPPLAEVADTGVPDQVDGVELRLDLEAALARLTPVQRAAVVARYLDDLPVATVAAQLGHTETWVKTTCRRALATMRRDAATTDLLTC